MNIPYDYISWRWTDVRIRQYLLQDVVFASKKSNNCSPPGRQTCCWCSFTKYDRKFNTIRAPRTTTSYPGSFLRSLLSAGKRPWYGLVTCLPESGRFLNRVIREGMASIHCFRRSRRSFTIPPKLQLVKRRHCAFAPGLMSKEFNTPKSFTEGVVVKVRAAAYVWRFVM